MSRKKAQPAASFVQHPVSPELKTFDVLQPADEAMTLRALNWLWSLPTEIDRDPEPWRPPCIHSANLRDD